MSKINVNEIGTQTGSDVAISSGKKLSGTASQFKMTDLVAGDTVYASADDTLARLAKGSASQTLKMNAGATAPEWVSVTSGFTDSCSLGMSADLTAINNTTLDCTFDTEIFDSNGSMANLANNRIDIANEGYYICGASIEMGSGGNGVSRFVYLYWYDYDATTTTLISKAGYGYLYTGGSGEWHAIALLFLGANDQLTAKCFQNSGSSRTVHSSTSRLWATRVE
jgi:hypothetical protein